MGVLWLLVSGLYYVEVGFRKIRNEGIESIQVLDPHQKWAYNTPGN
jgi:hypothetical protein